MVHGFQVNNTEDWYQKSIFGYQNAQSYKKG